MPKYKVIFAETRYYIADVEAKNRREAADKAYDRVIDGDYGKDFTIDADEFSQRPRSIKKINEKEGE